MKDNFDLYSWNKNRYLDKENKSKETISKDFDLYEWNKKRYLNELDINTTGGETDVDNLNLDKGGDDAKMGAELESDDNVVGENKSYLEKLAKYLNKTYPELDWEVSFGERIDAYGSAQDLANFGRKYHGKKFGEYEVFHVDDDDRLDIVRIIKSSKLREDINEASYMYKGYKDKHFDICPGAEALRDRLLAGEFKDNNWATGTNFEKEVGEWLYQHDVIFGIEKKIIKDKEGDERDVAKAKEAEGRVVNLSRDLGIPASEINAYLPAHIKTIKDMVEYSSLTEKEDDEFAGSDPKAGSTIQGTGFDWKKEDSIKETIKFIMDDLEGFSNYFPGGKTKGLTSKEMSTILMQIVKDIKDEGEQLDEGSMCKRGQNYMAARKRAGEKSSAYLSGRGVKVCKGQIKGSDGKKKKSY